MHCKGSLPALLGFASLQSNLPTSFDNLRGGACERHSPLPIAPAVQYEGGEPCSTCGHTKADVQLAPHDAAQPTEVLPKFLYLGSYDHASRAELLKVMDITHILNVSHCTRNSSAQG